MGAKEVELNLYYLMDHIMMNVMMMVMIMLLVLLILLILLIFIINPLSASVALYECNTGT